MGGVSKRVRAHSQEGLWGRLLFNRQAKVFCENKLRPTLHLAIVLSKLLQREELATN